MTQYAIRTDAMSKPQYFCGLVEEIPMGPGVVLSGTIFGAWLFDSREDAESLINDFLGNDYSVSECEVGMSSELDGDTQ